MLSKISQEPDLWPPELAVKISKGILLPILIVVAGWLLWWIIYPNFLDFENFTSLQNGIVQICVEIVELITTLYIFILLGKIRIKNFLAYKIPSIGLVFKWIYIGLSLSSYNFLLRFPFGSGAQLPDFIPIHLLSFFSSVILAPISEEITFRGVFYSSIRKEYGKRSAYVLSVLLFIFVHDSIQVSLWENNWIDFLHKVVPFVIMAFLLAYIYESTRSLILCIIFHSTFNFVYQIAPIAGFYFGGYTVEVP